MSLPIQTLQSPYLVVRIVPDFEGLNLAPLQNLFFYGYVEQINYATVGFAVGDIVQFEKKIINASVVNNGQEYYIVSENDVNLTALSTATRIFDDTFNYTFL